MMSTIVIIVLCLCAFLLQALLGYRQIKHFGAEFSAMRKDGRVAIGRALEKYEQAP